MKELTMADVLGPAARDEMVAFSESKTTAQVEKERRKAQFEADLVKRMPDLLAWNRNLTQEMVKVRGENGYWTVRPATTPCPTCAKLRKHLESIGLTPKGLVVFSADLPSIDQVGLAVPRHDRYHVEVAYTAIRKAEYEARVERRKQGSGNNHKAFASKAQRVAKESANRKARREADRARGKAMGCGTKKH